jgi:CheY-like chemotaxis protein
MAHRLSESAVSAARNRHFVASSSPEQQPCVELEKHCAYNQTTEHLLASDVHAGDFSVASFNNRIPTLAANSGVGVWQVPFRGISFISEQIPLDLVYLDANSIVIDIVESFPIFSISKASPSAASVLVLPRHTIYSTETRRGDQLLFCTAAEFNQRILQFPSPNDSPGTALRVDSVKAQQVCDGSGSRLQSDDFSGQSCLSKDAYRMDLSPSHQARGDVWNDRERENVKPTKNWLQRWWSLDPPEPRKAPRETFPHIAAHFWTSGIPVEHGVRDISLTGLYVITDERWFPDTLVRLTLIDSEESASKNSITANTRVVRWGNDGVGLTFVMKNEKDLRRGQTPLGGGLDRKELNRFLDLARSGKRNREIREAHLMVPPQDNNEDINGHTDPVFNDLFIGPINSSLLIDSLKDLPRPISAAGASPLMNLSHASTLPLHGVVPSTPPKRRPCILLIDDDYLDIMFLADTLEEDYEVIFASDGVAALESASHNLPDLILLDVMMPGIDGFEVCRRLKAENRTKEIPVIFITGLSEAAAETKGLKMGAVDYISKPFHSDQLKAGVNLHISARRHGKAKSN